MQSSYRHRPKCASLLAVVCGCLGGCFGELDAETGTAAVENADGGPDAGPGPRQAASIPSIAGLSVWTATQGESAVYEEGSVCSLSLSEPPSWLARQSPRESLGLTAAHCLVPVFEVMEENQKKREAGAAPIETKQVGLRIWYERDSVISGVPDRMRYYVHATRVVVHPDCGIRPGATSEKCPGNDLAVVTMPGHIDDRDRIPMPIWAPSCTELDRGRWFTTKQHWDAALGAFAGSYFETAYTATTCELVEIGGRSLEVHLSGLDQQVCKGNSGGILARSDDLAQVAVIRAIRQGSECSDEMWASLVYESRTDSGFRTMWEGAVSGQGASVYTLDTPPTW